MVSDHDALLAAICATPADDAVRLVYADWLDEHDQGKRATFIRAGVERHRCESADTAVAAFGKFLDACGWFPAGSVDWSTVDEEMDRFHKAMTRAGSARKPTPRSANLPTIKGLKF